MESCFPPLASLSLRSGGGNNTADNNCVTVKNHKNNRHSTGGGGPPPTQIYVAHDDIRIQHTNGGGGGGGGHHHLHNQHLNYINGHQHNGQKTNEILPKLEVLQDLDLYYIRQIASSLKVNNEYFFLFHNLTI